MSRAVLAQALRSALRHDGRTRAELASLEAALEVCELTPIVCDFAETEPPKQWSKRHPPSECRGAVYQRVCADCAFAVARCDQHGGGNATSREAWLHRVREHNVNTEEETDAATKGKRR